jgi:hypothetical protein
MKVMDELSQTVDLDIEVESAEGGRIPGLGWTEPAEVLDAIKEIDANLRVGPETS